MKWYKRDPDAWLSGVACLTPAERGAYSTLVDYYYSRDGHVLDDDWLLSRIMGCNPRTWRKLKIALFQKQKVRVNSDGCLVPNRGEYTLNEARTFSEAQSKRSRKRWKSEQNQSSDDAKAAMPKQPQPQQDIERKIDSCRIADAMPTMQAIKKNGKPRLAYDSGFDVFWAAYPTTRNMSKKEAWDVWRRLPTEDRQLAIDAVPKYADWLKGKGEKAPETIHACRFLSKRRFEGHAQAPVNISPTQFYAAFGSIELEAWDAYGRLTRGRDYPRDKRGGWSFPARWPPKSDRAEA